QIVALAHEEWMLLHVQHDIQIASRASSGTNFASSGEADARAVFHPRGNLRIHRTLPQNAAFPFALGAGIGDHAARSLAGGASARDAEKSLLVTHLAAPRAGAACGRTFARSGPGAAAFLASFVTAHQDSGLSAEGSLFEFNG